MEQSNYIRDMSDTVNSDLKCRNFKKISCNLKELDSRSTDPSRSYSFYCYIILGQKVHNYDSPQWIPLPRKSDPPIFTKFQH